MGNMKTTEQVSMKSDSWQTGYVFAGQGGWNSREEAARSARQDAKICREDFSTKEFNAGWKARKGR